MSVLLYVRECNKLYTFSFQWPYLQTFPHLKHGAGNDKNVDPKDIAKLEGALLILGCHLKPMEHIGEGTCISNSEILL